MNRDSKELKSSPSSERRPLSVEGSRPNDESDMRMVQRLPDQPRQPTNLQDVLRFAVEATNSEDSTFNSRVQPLDEERKKFLDEALSSMSVNVLEELRKAAKVLSNAVNLRPDDDPTEYNTALEIIADSVDNTDIANDFYKIGGFAIFGSCLNSYHSSVRWKAADIIAELTQNNPFCQDKILEMGLMPILLSMVDNDPSEKVRIKSLYAVSCIVRGNSLSLRYMNINNGYSILFRAMQSPVEKLQIKSAFLLAYLCNRENVDTLRKTLVEMGLIEQVSGLLAGGNLHLDTREQLLRILKGLTSDNYLPVMRECRRFELRLNGTLDRCLREAMAENSVDEAEICRGLLDRIFSDRDADQER